MLAALKFLVLSTLANLTPTWYPPGAGPETPQERMERWTMVGEVITESAMSGLTEFWPQDNAKLALMITHGESRIDYHVHAGLPSPIGHQDYGSAKCLGQIQWHERMWPNKEDWEALAGLSREATRRCIDAILTIMWIHAKRCELRKDVPEFRRWKAPLSTNEVRVLVSAYGSGVSCKPVSKKHKKVQMFKWFGEWM